MLLAIFWRRIVLPVRGGATMTPRWPKPERGDQVDDPHVGLFGGRFQPDPALRMQRRQIVEADLLAELVGILEVDRLDAQEGEVTFVFLGRPDLARDDRAGFQAEAADLAGRDVNVVRAGEVVVIGASQEAESVGKDLERPLAVHEAVLLDPLFQDLEDQVLLFQPHVVDDALGLGRADQLGHRHLLKLGEVDLAALDVFVAVVERGIAEDVVFHVGKLARQIAVKVWWRGAFGANGRCVLAITRGRIRHFAFGPFAITRRGPRRGLPYRGREPAHAAAAAASRMLAVTVAITIASHGDPLVVDRPARRARRGRVPDARAPSFPARARTTGSRTGSRSRWRMNRIGSRSAGPFLAVGLAILPVTRLVDSRRRPVHLPWNKTVPHLPARHRPPPRTERRSCGCGTCRWSPGGDESRWPWGSILLFNLLFRSLGRTNRRAWLRFVPPLAAMFDSGVVIDDQISPAALFVSGPLGLLASL